jgi:hypothetical protein
MADQRLLRGNFGNEARDHEKKTERENEGPGRDSSLELGAPVPELGAVATSAEKLQNRKEEFDCT